MVLARVLFGQACSGLGKQKHRGAMFLEYKLQIATQLPLFVSGGEFTKTW